MDGAQRGVGMTDESKSSARSHRFPKEMRLRKRHEFLAVQKTGEKFHGRHFLAVIAPRAATGQDAGMGRVGITITKKIGNAVTRNRIKRLVREHIRRCAWVPPGMDVVIIAKRSGADLESYEAVTADLSRIRARMRASGGSRLFEARPGGR